MAETSAFTCLCGSQFQGAAAVNHISGCVQRRSQSRLSALCTDLRSDNPHALVYELIAEIQTSCNNHLSNELVLALLAENLAHHGRFINRDDCPETQNPVQAEEVVKLPEVTCSLCGIPKVDTLSFPCGHVICETHLGQVLTSEEGKCSFPQCGYVLSAADRVLVREKLGAEESESKQLKEEIEGLVCSLCGKAQGFDAIIFLDCMHNICREHISSVFEEQYKKSSAVQCPMAECQYFLSIPELETVVGADRVAEADTALALKLVRDLSSIFITCSKCGFSCALEKGSIDFNFKNEKGEKISEEAAVHMSKHRFRCPKCLTTKCATCGIEPFHEGFTCDTFRVHSAKPSCRHCKKPLETEKCLEKDCQARSENECPKTLPCGHLCNGVREEIECGPCLICAGSDRDLCIICSYEELSAAPSVRLACGHTLHYHCLDTILQRRWIGPRITFTFAKCPACHVWAEALGLPALKTRVEEIEHLYDVVRDKAMKRLVFEHEDQLPRLLDPKDAYFSQPEKYALDRFCYYECYSCKHPYFGGKKDCQRQDEEKEFNPQELVCPRCVSAGGAGVCVKHGEDFIQFKCKYCCDLAVWFCWGTTHFCEPCHNIWEQRRDAAKEDLPQCPGLPLCPLQVAHPPNGEEFSLGCAACREELDKVQEF